MMKIDEMIDLVDKEFSRDCQANKCSDCKSEFCTFKEGFLEIQKSLEEYGKCLEVLEKKSEHNEDMSLEECIKENRDMAIFFMQFANDDFGSDKPHVVNTSERNARYYHNLSKWLEEYKELKEKKKR